MFFHDTLAPPAFETLFWISGPLSAPYFFLPLVPTCFALHALSAHPGPEGGTFQGRIKLIHPKGLIAHLAVEHPRLVLVHVAGDFTHFTVHTSPRGYVFGPHAGRRHVAAKSMVSLPTVDAKEHDVRRPRRSAEETGVLPAPGQRVRSAGLDDVRGHDGPWIEAGGQVADDDLLLHGGARDQVLFFDGGVGADAFGLGLDGRFGVTEGGADDFAVFGGGGGFEQGIDVGRGAEVKGFGFQPDAGVGYVESQGVEDHQIEPFSQPGVVVIFFAVCEGIDGGQIHRFPNDVAITGSLMFGDG
mmetsp:Transcript_4744/g.9336  ORF Transcript_4744/g.9336 Transcript_4744/m.9336 type:complete len:300 (-) Transcript_4744:1298-2197(-)